MKSSLLIGLLLGVFQLLYAQNTNFLDEKQMGCQNITAVCQDEHNFLWLATDEGLRRFDGTQFVTYYHDESDSTSLASDNVMDLLIDRSQRLWVGTGNGLQCYFPERDCFQTVQLEAAGIQGYITSIVQRKNGEIYFVVSGMGLYRLDPENMMGYRVQTLNRYYHNRYLYLLYEDSRQRLWLGTDRQGLVHIDLTTQEEKLYKLPPTSVNDIVEDQEGGLYVITNYEVYRLDETVDRLVPLAYKGDKHDFYFSRATLTTDGHILIGTKGHGVMEIKKGSRTITDFLLYNPFIDTNRIRVSSLFADKQ